MTYEHPAPSGYGARVPLPPSTAVLDAFGADGVPRLLGGGEGTSWVVGDLVLKPEAGPIHTWVAEALAVVTFDEVRVATPVQTRGGGWSHAGWSATQWLDGDEPTGPDVAMWVAVIEAGRAFHRAVSRLDRPSFLHSRRDRWAQADRVAWGERQVAYHPLLADSAARLRRALRPSGPARLVHGDLTGNVLLSDVHPPAVLDVSPYWRPTSYAEGVVLADALCWHGAPASLLQEAGVPVPAVARGLLFRLATTNEVVAPGVVPVDLEDEARCYRSAVVLLGL